MERINLAPEEDMTAFACDITDTEEFAIRISSMYKPKNGFYDQFEKEGGVKTFISVTLATLKLWKNTKLAEMWEMWLKEL